MRRGREWCCHKPRAPGTGTTGSRARQGDPTPEPRRGQALPAPGARAPDLQTQGRPARCLKPLLGGFCSAANTRPWDHPPEYPCLPVSPPAAGPLSAQRTRLLLTPLCAFGTDAGTPLPSPQGGTRSLSGPGARRAPHSGSLLGLSSAPEPSPRVSHTLSLSRAPYRNSSGHSNFQGDPLISGRSRLPPGGLPPMADPVSPGSPHLSPGLPHTDARHADRTVSGRSGAHVCRPRNVPRAQLQKCAGRQGVAQAELGRSAPLPICAGPAVAPSLPERPPFSLCRGGGTPVLPSSPEHRAPHLHMAAPRTL